MLLKNPFKKQKDINERIGIIKNGDNSERNMLIEDYKPFIINIVSKETGRFVSDGDCDELSIGLMAFNEAIDRFDIHRSKSFFSFAERVIKNRLIDFYRKEKKNLETIPISYLNEAYDNENIEEKYFADSSQMEAQDVSEEMEDFKRKLSAFGISLEELVESSPKHLDTRKNAVKIASCIVKNDILMKKIIDSKKMPVSEIEKHLNVSRKVIHKNKKYILAVCLILTSKNEIIKSYVDNLLKEVECNE
ncbi:RNA polymerase sigma-I factor [Lutispora thermophila]|uniref:RNA polymerase sigma factor SigI n=1 Tax=Lutispora thermophila DSM 19022 TaxID=1122184 RepID=A0A1M6CGT0_9FIRM|nr:RNA polymerase sigma-I factor [Lutispora thermophila]SHI60219.1 RNA polymerase sigma factor [Lutispora thermophila DSM 19022]